MKKIAIVLTLLLVCGQFAMAQYDPQAKDILDRVSSKYSKIKAFKATFVNKLENEAAGVDEEYEGIVYIKDDLFKLEIDTRAIFFDGKLIRDYDGDTQEYSIRDPDPEVESLNLTTVLNLYKEGYKYRVREQNANGYVIELIPVDVESKSFNKILMNFSTTYDVKSFTYFEKKGNLVTTLVKEFEVMPELSRSFFNLYQAKLEVLDSIDLR